MSPHAATAEPPIHTNSLPSIDESRTKPESMSALPSTRSKTLFVTLMPVAFSMKTTAERSSVQSPPDGIACGSMYVYAVSRRPRPAMVTPRVGLAGDVPVILKSALSCGTTKPVLGGAVPAVALK